MIESSQANAVEADAILRGTGRASYCQRWNNGLQRDCGVLDNEVRTQTKERNDDQASE